jgi:ketosteroid isomerase-like protein
MEDLERAVAELRDRQAIAEVLATYSRAVDRLDRALLLSVYHPDAIDDHGVFIGNPEDFADWVIAMHTASHLSHQHCVLNHTCDLDGDVAHTEAYYLFIGMNRAGTPVALSGGRYLDRMERRDGRWAIAARVCVRDWAPLREPATSLDQSRMTVVQDQDDALRAILRGGPQPSRDRRDPSYDRPLEIPAERVEAFRRRAGRA